jgi:hypothetical protein
MRVNNVVMLRQGYVPATAVASTLEKSLSTIHRLIDAGYLKQVRDGKARYVLLADLKGYYKGNKVMLSQIAVLESWANKLVLEHDRKEFSE